MRTETDTETIAFPSIDDVPQECWVKLTQSRIFFGHQSVGYDIVDGMTEVIHEHPEINLNIVETSDLQEHEKPLFAHVRIGRNTDPLSKIRAFREIMESSVGDCVDIAFFKFCYIDIMRDSDPKDIFDNYAAAMKQLKSRFARTKFLHVTVPIRSMPSGVLGGLKQSVKSLLGKPCVLDDNIVRSRYNELLTDAYGRTEPIFDLALAESINPHGSRCYAGNGAQTVCVMAPENTYDGGHLSVVGRRFVAERLLITLGGITCGFQGYLGSVRFV